jgi:hypothetical protein
MKIELERSGGFAGIKLKRSLDSADLSPSQAKRLENLLESAQFFDWTPERNKPDQGPDRFHYRLTIEAERGTRTIEVGEASLPLSMRSLLHWLEKHTGR